VKRYAALLVAIVVAWLAAGCGGDGGIAKRSGGSQRCDAGYVDAELPWGFKCLVHGESCKQDQDEAYHRYGFHCHADRRLTRS
jgi:hypothetical protein